jgi:hypothetical protein
MEEKERWFRIPLLINFILDEKKVFSADLSKKRSFIFPLFEIEHHVLDTNARKQLS